MLGLATVVTAAAQSSAVQVLLEKARTQEGRGRLDLATQTWRHVLLADRDNQEALAGLARAAKKAGKPEEAKSYLDRLRGINPKHESIAQIETMRPTRISQDRLAQAGTLAGQQRFSEAMAIYREVLGDEPPPGSLAIAYYETMASTPNGWEAATAGMSRLVARYPESVEYQFTLARLYTYRPKTRAEGIKMLQAIPTDSPFALRVQPALRQALLWDGPLAANAAAIRAYVARHPDSEVEALLAKMPKAEPARVVPVQSPMEASGYAALKAGNLKGAAEHFEAALHGNGSSVTALLGLGYVRMQERNFAAARELFERARTAAPENKEVAEALSGARFWALMGDGTRAMQTKRVADAQSIYEEALKIRPNYPHALRGLSGALMGQNKHEEATVVLATLTEQEPENAEAWRELIRAHYDAKGAEAALAALEKLPVKVALRLADDMDHQALLASVYSSAGRHADAAKAMERSAQTATRVKKQSSPATTLQFAGIWLSQGQHAKAAELYQQVVDREPSNLVAWEGLLASLVNLRDDKRSSAVLTCMPKETYEEAMRRPGFVRAAALVETNAGRFEQAEKLLVRMIADQGDKPDLNTQIQLANVWIKQKRADKAEPMLRGLAKQHPDEPQLWKLLILMLEQDHRTGEAMLLAQRIPAETRLRLFNDPDFVALMASAASAEGDDAEALRLVQTAEKRLAQQGKQPSPDLLLQHGWLALKTDADDREIYGALKALQASEHLEEAQEKNMRKLWSVWTRKRADAARADGDLNRAVALLDAGHKMLPDDSHLRASLAGALVESGHHRRAVALYKMWGLKNAAPGDYVAAIGAAMSEDQPLGERWMADALAKWPGNPDVFNLAGKFAAQRGDFDQARAYWRAALSSLSPAKRQVVKDPAWPATFEDLELNRRPSTAAGSTPAGRKLGVAFATEIVPPGVQPARESSMVRALDPDNEARLGAQPVLVASNAIAPRDDVRTTRVEVERQIAAVEARNASYTGFGGGVDSRSGRTGFEKRTLQEVEMEASRTLGDTMRVALIAKPTYVDAGVMDGLSELRFGLLPKGASLGRQTASGIAAEVQMSTNSFGISAGLTPQGFAVQNWVGGLRFRPGNGPFQLKLTREAVRDTLLSFAGSKDPVTNQTWGGVVASGANVQANFGGAASGWYAGASYQLITGRNVQNNRRVDGTVGAYWRAFTNEFGKLTVGANAFTMRYDKNLRYFTLGHGGYFSPQSFYLVNMPLTWTGRHRDRLLYTISGAFGVQKFREDSSAMFPTLTALQGPNGSFYPSLSNTGANYSLQASMLYQIAPHWYAGGFLSMNNTRSYNTQTAGFTVKYLFQMRPLISDQDLPSIPNWIGQQPFQPK